MACQLRRDFFRVDQTKSGDLADNLTKIKRVCDDNAKIKTAKKIDVQADKSGIAKKDAFKTALEKFLNALM